MSMHAYVIFSNFKGLKAQHKTGAFGQKIAIIKSQTE